jgi:hypothetical protein
MKKTVRTSLGIREVLFDELDKLRDGTSNPSRANAVAKTATSIINTVRLELEHAKFVTALGEDSRAAKVEPLRLGN